MSLCLGVGHVRTLDAGPDGQITALPVQPLSEKYFASPVGQITTRTPAVSCPQEGRWPSSLTLGAGCGGRGSAARRAALTRTAKSCGSDTPTLVSSFAGMIRVTTVAKEPGHREEHEISRKTIA